MGRFLFPTPTTTTITITEGRPPWYDERGRLKEPIFIGICGASSSGKSALCKEIMRQLQMQWVVQIGLESFYRDLTPEQARDPYSFNFDSPEAFDWDAALRVLSDIKHGRRAEIPVYDFASHRRAARQKVVYGVDVVLFEGILAYHDPRIRALMDIKLFVEVDDDIRLCRRLKRDVNVRGRPVELVLKQYERFVKPSFDRFILPLRKAADVIVPGAGNQVVVDLIVKRVQKVLSDRGWAPVLAPLMGDELPRNVHLLTQTPRVRAMQTIVRDRKTSHDDFIFYSDRLHSLLIEAALALLPYDKCTVTTPTGSAYDGEKFRLHLCGVSIMRCGCTMEEPLRRIAKGVRVGKILIESDEAKRPSLLYVKLPGNIKGRHVMLLDPMLVSGATVTMAIHVLLDHGVLPADISFVTGVASFQGLHEVMRKFPDLTVVTGAVERMDLNEKGYLVAGQGYCPERYFG